MPLDYAVQHDTRLEVLLWRGLQPSAYVQHMYCMYCVSENRQAPRLLSLNRVTQLRIFPRDLFERLLRLSILVAHLLRRLCFDHYQVPQSLDIMVKVSEDWLTVDDGTKLYTKKWEVGQHSILILLDASISFTSKHEDWRLRVLPLHQSLVSCRGTQDQHVILTG